MSNRDEFLRQMESQLNIWRTQLAQIKSKSENLDKARRKEIEEEYCNLQLQIREFQNRMIVIGKAEAWQRLKDEVENLRQEVGESIGKIASVINGRP